MALTSALYTGLSGLNVNQRRLNVIGNNIANVNTVAFKSSRAMFKPQFYVTDTAGSSPTSISGGTNPSQRGLGATVASIQKNFNPGSIETTGVKTDLAIDGNGFFIVGAGSDQKFTRDGSFLLNEDNQLVTSDGQYVQGYDVDKDYNVMTGQLSRLTVPEGSLMIAKPTTETAFIGNLNANGPVATGASILESPPMLDEAGDPPAGGTALVDLRLADDLTRPMFEDGQVLAIEGKRGGSALPEATLTIDATTTLDQLNSFLGAGMAIDRSAKVVAAAPAGFTPGVALAGSTATGDPAGSLRLQITGNAGKHNELALTNLRRSPAGLNTSPIVFGNAPTSDAVGEGTHTSMNVFDSLGTPLTVELTFSLESKEAGAGTVWRYFATSAADSNAQAYTGAPGEVGSVLQSGTVTFTENGLFKASTDDTIAIDRVESGAVTPSAVRLDFSALTAFSDESKINVNGSDGFGAGSLTTFAVETDGNVKGFFTNGQTRTLGRVAMANFDNPLGLVDEGGNNYRAGASSGQPIVGTPGQFGTGELQSGALEQSNVDLSKEFIDMIVTTTGFSAASRVITTSDRLLNELLQTSR